LAVFGDGQHDVQLAAERNQIAWGAGVRELLSASSLTVIERVI
jgi:hypothetical protein